MSKISLQTLLLIVVVPIGIITIGYLVLDHQGIRLFQPSINLDQTQVQFVLNDTNDLVDHKVVLIKNPSRVTLIASLPDSNFSKLVDFQLSPKKAPEEITINAYGSRLTDLHKNSYGGQIQLYAINETGPNNSSRLVGKLKVGIKISPNPFSSAAASIDPKSFELVLSNNTKVLFKTVHIHVARPVNKLALSIEGPEELKKIMKIVYPSASPKQNLVSDEDYFVYLKSDAKWIGPNLGNGMYEGIIKVSYVDMKLRNPESTFATISEKIDMSNAP
jgi:hypothetical protein